MRRLIPIIVLCLTLGCVSTKEMTPERCGPQPTMEQAEALVNSYVQNMNLLDPGSAQVRNIQVVKPYGIANIGGKFFGWLISFELNAKNAYGGYVGFQTHRILSQPMGGYWVVYQ